MKKKFKVKKSKIQGKGCFASHKIKKGEIICTFKGKEVSITKLKKLFNDDKARDTDPLQISYSKYLLLKKPYIYFNHSCSPNSSLIKKATLIAIKDIEKDEEIAYDYSMTEDCNKKNAKLWGKEFSYEWQLPCSCKSKNCRKIIREFRKISKKIKDKYFKEKILQDHILREYS